MNYIQKYIYILQIQNSTVTMESSLEAPQNLKIELPYDPVISVYILPKLKALSWRDNCTHVLKAALFTTDKRYKQIASVY